MRAMQVTGPGIEHLKLVDLPVPAAGPGEVQVRIKTATLNYRDLLLMQNGNPDGKVPYVPLSCACGEVTAVGSGVTRFKNGDRVMPAFFQNWFSGPIPSRDSVRALGGILEGVACEFACFPEIAVVKAPDTLGDLEAAALPCAGLTAWSALFVARATKPGDVVLLLGTGGVSIAGLQLAKAAGASVIITSSSDSILARARALGADHTINYVSTPSWGDHALALAGGRGVDIVLEVGGAATLPQSARALREGGQIAGIGLLTGTTVWKEKNPPAQLLRIRVGNREQLEDLVRGVVATGIRPVIDRVFPLEDLGRALQTLRAGAFFGKIGIEIAR
jgi:NADPH:quinone reductase-like Zn-dependent oxidoreductase